MATRSCFVPVTIIHDAADIKGNSMKKIRKKRSFTVFRKMKAKIF